MLLSAGFWLMNLPMEPGEVQAGTELFLMTDGRLAEVTIVTRNPGGERLVSIPLAEQLEPDSVLMSWDLGVLMTRIDVRLLELTAPDPEARRERFRQLMVRVTEALLASTEGLEAAVQRG